MKRYILVLALGTIAVPALGQSRVMLTNADLVPHTIAWKAPPPSAGTLAGLRARQFVWYPRSYPGPSVYVTASREPSAGPWPWPEPTPPRRLDGTLLSSPPVVYGLPWYYSFVGVGDRSTRRR